MAFADFTPETTIQENQDALGFKIWDKSVWNGESGICTQADVYVKFYDSDGNLIEFDMYPMIVGADKTKFNQYLSSDGHEILLSALLIGGAAHSYERFPDGYYMIDVIYDDGTYTPPNEPHFLNNQAFLAKSRCKKRKAGALLPFPLTDETRIMNYDIFMLGMYLESCEDAVDLGKYTEFTYIMELINEIYSTYAIEECF